MDLQQFTEYIQLFSAFLVALSGLLVAVGAIVRPLRNWVLDRLGDRKRKEYMEKTIESINTRLMDYKDCLDRDRAEQLLIKQATIASLRNDITEIYNRGAAQGYLGDYDRENFLSMVEVYFALGGNHYVKELNDRVLKMPNKPPRKRTRTTRK
jgi:hypothetical protein